MDPASKAIEQQLRDDKRKLNDEMKILLLGAGESGKSTIAKQFKIINNGDYSEEELKDYKVFILDNTFASIKALVNAADKLAINIGEDAQPAAQKIRDIDPMQKSLTPDLAQDIKTIWNDPGIQETYKRSSEYQLNDNAQYCLDNIDRIASENYSPTQQDVIRCRVRTTGVIETHFEMNKRRVRLVDVGGQRAERRKWMGCFEDVTAVIFCLALSEYDLKLAEDDKTNRMHESIRIFEELTGRWFPRTTIVLFLNKKDIFAEKIKKVPLKVCFSDYDGDNSFEHASDYIRDKFIKLDKCEQARCYPHITCATDTDNVRKVFEAVKDTLVKANLAAAGYM